MYLPDETMASLPIPCRVRAGNFEGIFFPSSTTVDLEKDVASPVPVQRLAHSWAENVLPEPATAVTAMDMEGSVAVAHKASCCGVGVILDSSVVRVEVMKL